MTKPGGFCMKEVYLHFKTYTTWQYIFLILLENTTSDIWAHLPRILKSNLDISPQRYLPNFLQQIIVLLIKWKNYRPIFFHINNCPSLFICFIQSFIKSSHVRISIVCPFSNGISMMNI